jgi:hypothetical protein
MEGDMKDIVLQRLEQRLKEKDGEIRSLKNEIEASGASAEELSGLKERVDRLELDATEVRVTLSEVMKKVGALESALSSMLAGMANADEVSHEEDLSIPGMMPADSQYVGTFAADADLNDVKEDEGSDAAPENGDTLRFFHLSKNS